MRILSNTVALLLAGWLPLSQAGEDYLLTGVIAASGGGKAFAVIEQADGVQRLVSEGDALGDGHVAAIHADTKTVRLALPDGDLLLTLRGSAHPDEKATEYRIEDYLEETTSFSLDESAQQGLRELARNADKLGDEKSTARLKQLLGLSADASITAFNEERVDSTRQVLQQLSQVLSSPEPRAPHVGTLSVAENSGRRRVYLMSSTPSTQP